MRAGKSASVRVSSAKNPYPMPGSSCVADVTLEDLRRLLNQGNRRVTLEWQCGCGGVSGFWVQQAGKGLGTVWSRPSTARLSETVLKEGSGMVVC